MPLRPKSEWLSQAGGHFVTCSFGQTHYQLLGEPSSKPLVVCVHGITADGSQFASLVKVLNAAGYQCLLVDLYGRGFSDGIDSHYRYDVAIFTTQLSELLLHVHPATNGKSTSAIHLIGTSMGGAVSVRFTELHPQLVKSLTLACPAGLPWDTPGIAKLVKVPLLGEMMLSMVGKSATAKNTAKAYADHTREGAKQHWERTLERSEQLGKYHPGFGPGFLNTVRNFELNGLEATYAAVGKTDIPVLLLWGDKDIVVPFETNVLAQKLLPQAKFVALQDCGHVDFFCVPELQEVFHKAVVDHMTGVDGKGE
eukprot:TRINITY_DN8894_c0_g1_i1.p2 TRINITY_DN8894_c0_g1~~TRINITY_DN8894_c0_g1_i1.p2  ORF type:complete len:310 (+),score=80.49 TRINITY_DN8894_c0_g1_i1:1525-2454(+)